MRTPLVLLGLSSSAALPLGAQSAWLVGLGVERYDQADALASPLRYGATDPWIAVAWRHQGRTLSGVAVSFAPARLTARPSGPGSHYYVLIPPFADRAVVDGVDAALAALSGEPQLVLDVRHNGGGSHNHAVAIVERRHGSQIKRRTPARRNAAAPRLS